MGQAPISGCHKHTYPSGDIFEGLFENSQRNGAGECKYSNGDSYSGSWAADKRHGFGTMSYNHDESSTKTVDDDPLPTYVPNDPNSLRFRAYKRAQLYRKQQNQQANVFLGTYEGFWLSDKRNAFGRFTYSNNDVYYGEFSNDQRQGQGLLALASKDEFIGQYHHNMIHGWGTMKLQVLDGVPNLVEATTTRVGVLEASVMENLFKQLQVKPPQKYQALIDHAAIIRAHITLLTRPAADVQQTQIISQLLDFAIQSETLKQKKILQMAELTELYDIEKSDVCVNIPFVTHSVEIEGYWANNQLSGPNLTPTTSPAAKSDAGFIANTNGFAIYRKYIPITHDIDIMAILDQNANTSLTSSIASSHKTASFSMVFSQYNVEYLCTIQVVPITVARRVVETFGKVDINVLIDEVNNEMAINDDEFDDFMNENNDDEGHDDHMPIDALLSQSSPAAQVVALPVDSTLAQSQQSLPAFDGYYESNGIEECHTAGDLNNLDLTSSDTSPFQISKEAQDAMNRADMFDYETDVGLYAIEDE